ncbi:hypothetical protein [Terriglobus sp. ADX1]|uniref:hypothetical protein n=1 Tax=Terriglobus sp. ADX1 TaxID=2794063 RepID=UPI002FE539E1
MGRPVNKLSENGTFASTQTSFCNLVQITPANLILSAFSQMEHSLTAAIQRGGQVAAFA